MYIMVTFVGDEEVMGEAVDQGDFFHLLLSDMVKTGILQGSHIFFHINSRNTFYFKLLIKKIEDNMILKTDFVILSRE